MPLSGLMCERSMDHVSLAKWASSLPDFHASPIVSLDSAEVKLTSVISGRTPLDSFAKWERDSSCWRTFQASLLTGMEEPLLGSFPKLGMIVSGTAYRLQPLVPHIIGAVGGYWHTPMARDWKGYTRRQGESICNQLREIFPDTSGIPHPEFVENLMGLPIGWTGLEPVGMVSYQQWSSSF